ncbi:MAG: hypothetical protein IT366_21480 [Candidatus Hydrogenedentes bacterium]|nr:hypothetical protein [Candidatus Hydrogenedentota bacterium]
MQHLGDFRIDQYVTFGVQLHRFSSGAVYAPTGSVTYTFYENNSTSGAPTGGNLAQLNSKTGLYSARVQLTTAAGFEAGKDYFVHVEATVDSVAAGELFMFRVVDVPTVDVTSLGGSTQSATDLKDFADTGYDPSAHKVQGVVLADTVTTLTNAPSDSSGVTSLLNRLTSTRAGYLDNLSGGAVALASQILDAAGIRTAVGLASANLDTQFGLVATASKLLKYFQLLLRKDAAIATDNATELTAINANGGSGAGAFANTTDSVEAVRDRGDAAWTTATGFSTLDAAGVRTAVGMASANLDTQLGSLAAAAELAKVPKSDGTATWNATALASIQSKCADALAASDAIGAASVSAAAGAKIADIMLRRGSANIEASSNGDTLAFKSLYGAIAMQTHEKDASSGTSLEVKKADGSTTLATITLDTDAAAEPIVGTGSA